MKKIPVISSQSWNSLVATIKRRRPIRFSGAASRGAWSHPWKISPTWDIESKQWLFRIKPGFVNGVEVTAWANQNRVSARTTSRVSKEENKPKTNNEYLNAYLSEWPLLEVGETRIIGTGSNATDVAGSVLSSDAKLVYEPVPEFFEELGVTSKNLQISDGGGSDFGIQFLEEGEDSPESRRLRACDVSLWKDRLSAKIVLDDEGSINITYDHSGGFKRNPYLRISPRFKPPEEPEGPLELLQGKPDPEFDTLKVATIYFLSPPGMAPDSPLDEKWTPYVGHDLFWNLAHSQQSIPDTTPIEPIKLVTGLGLGVADSIFDNLLDPINEQYKKAMQILKYRDMSGRFWSL